MKFTLNHEYRFDNYKIAFLAGFMQMVMIMTVELVNMYTILTCNEVKEVVMNFMALAIIAEFDDIFYAALGLDTSKEVLTDQAYDDLWVITRTTSISAKNKIERHLLSDDTYVNRNRPDQEVSDANGTNQKEEKTLAYIYIDFWLDRSFLQKILRILYKVFRSFYVSIWFYFMPFLIILGSYYMPKNYGASRDGSTDKIDDSPSLL